MSARSLAALDREITVCRACPRLVEWREQVSREKRAGLRDCEYWGRPVPPFGTARARLLIVGLAPGAHGANRTGRPFTGDGAGPFLYGALHRAGAASRPISTARGDGLELHGVRLTNAVRCVPPGNRPSPEEVRGCRGYLIREIQGLGELAAILCLGAIAWQATLAALAELGAEIPRPRPRFAHGAEVPLGGRAPFLLAAYHPSQLNTRTGRLSPAMFDAVLRRALQARG